MRRLISLRRKWLTWFHDHSGVAALMTVFSMVFLLGFAAMVIDVGHVMLARTELQNAADAAALAGARGFFPPGTPPLTPDVSNAKAKAADYVHKNYADAYVQPGGLNINPDDVQTGVWRWATSKFEPTNVTYEPNPDTILAIQVTVRKEPGTTNNNPVAMTLARVVGVTETNVNAQAVAVNEMPLGGTKKCGTFILAVPGGCATSACGAITRKYPIHLRNDSDDTAGWASFGGPISASYGKCQAQQMGVPCGGKLKGGCKSTDCESGVPQIGDCTKPENLVYTQNGVDAAVIMTLYDSWVQCGYRLEMIVPVVEGDCNSTSVKWNGTKCVVGFAVLVIDKNDPIYPGYVKGPPDNELSGYVYCQDPESEPGPPAPPGYDYFGTVSLVPKLVQ